MHSIANPFIVPTLPPFLTLHSRRTTQISATLRFPKPPPPPSSPGQVYQPFRPPSSPIPAKYRTLGPLERLDILRDRLGLWYEYAPLISALFNDGFPPSSIEESTGITGVEQNRLVVAAQVRESLLGAPVEAFDPDSLPFFDHVSGAELLYALRFLNATQRAAAASYVVEHNLDGKGAQELGKAMKDFSRRRGDEGWECFLAASPGDCLAYTYFRRSREVPTVEERLEALEKAAEIAETEKAKARIDLELEKAAGRVEDEEDELTRVVIPIVRLKYGEVAEASSVVVLPVCKAAEGAEGITKAPEWCKAVGELGVVEAEKGWRRWVVMPGWFQVKEAASEGGAVAVEFDGRVLPWAKGGEEEGVLVVVDRKRRKTITESEEEGKKAAVGYFVVGEEKGLRIQRGAVLAEEGVEETLGMVVLVVRPPREDDDMLSDEDWD